MSVDKYNSSMKPDSLHATSLYSVAQLRAIENYVFDTLGVCGYDLMRRAAAGARDLLLRRWPDAKLVLIVCGSGNNGGDGYALARLLREAQIDVQLLALGEPEPDTEAAAALADWRASGGTLLPVDAAWPKADVLVDALFGTGLTRALEGVARAWVERVNASKMPVLSLDVPSGVNADTGHVPNVAVQADVTLSFIAHKRGLRSGSAPAYCGEILLDPLDLPDQFLMDFSADATLLDQFTLQNWLTPRRRDTNKGSYGHVLAIGGDLGMGGAIRFTGEAALRVGAGLVSVGTRAEHVTALNAARPELMVHAVAGIQELQPLLQRVTVVAIGPGLGQRAWGHALWHTAVAAGKPLVLDADGLNLLAREPLSLPAQAVLTPHPGEAARLLAQDTAAIARDRFAAVRELARRHNAVVVLKGAGSLIANPQGELAVCPWGNPGMASGGMGDVLTGVIAGLLAQGFDAWHAARVGVALHALAGDAAASQGGEAGLVASDLFIPLRRLRNGQMVS
jgi:ADP-dependent NAD(P)H-hydrate dehydratase / NAD(P)H-hydrate epimerase